MKPLLSRSVCAAVVLALLATNPPAFARPFAHFMENLQTSQFAVREAHLFFQGSHEFIATGGSSFFKKVEPIYQQLVEFSGGMEFKVVPGQTNRMGLSHAGGFIIIDLSTVQRGKDFLAYSLAHEWGHEALGHLPNLYNPTGQRWEFRGLGGNREDEADEYAGSFLGQYCYPLATILKEIVLIPGSSGTEYHSGKDRAEIVKKAYLATASENCSKKKVREIESDPEDYEPEEIAKVLVCREKIVTEPLSIHSTNQWLSIAPSNFAAKKRLWAFIQQSGQNECSKVGLRYAGNTPANLRRATSVLNSDSASSSCERNWEERESWCRSGVQQFSGTCTIVYRECEYE